MYYLNHYVVDWDKVTTLDDIKRLLAALDLSFEPDRDLRLIEDLVLLVPKNPPQATMD
jgi:hypothetical protein